MYTFLKRSKEGSIFSSNRNLVLNSLIGSFTNIYTLNLVVGVKGINPLVFDIQFGF